MTTASRSAKPTLFPANSFSGKPSGSWVMPGKIASLTSMAPSEELLHSLATPKQKHSEQPFGFVSWRLKKPGLQFRHWDNSSTFSCRKRRSNGRFIHQVSFQKKRQTVAYFTGARRTAGIFVAHAALNGAGTRHTKRFVVHATVSNRAFVTVVTSEASPTNALSRNLWRRRRNLLEEKKITQSGK